MRPAIFILLFSLLQPVLGETQRAEQLYTSQGCAACHQINQPVDPTSHGRSADGRGGKSLRQ